MLAREKSTSLAAIFSVELKFTIDTLNVWFSDTIKSKFLDLNDVKKQNFIKENSFVPPKRFALFVGSCLMYMQGVNIKDDKIL